jgi:hypothetical protein
MKLFTCGRSKYGGSGWWFSLFEIREGISLIEIGLAADIFDPGKPRQPYINFLFGLNNKISMWFWRWKIDRLEARRPRQAGCLSSDE